MQRNAPMNVISTQIGAGLHILAIMARPSPFHFFFAWLACAHTINKLTCSEKKPLMRLAYVANSRHPPDIEAKLSWSIA